MSVPFKGKFFLLLILLFTQISFAKPNVEKPVPFKCKNYPTSDVELIGAKFKVRFNMPALEGKLVYFQNGKQTLYEPSIVYESMCSVAVTTNFPGAKYSLEGVREVNIEVHQMEVEGLSTGEKINFTCYYKNENSITKTLENNTKRITTNLLKFVFGDSICIEGGNGIEKYYMPLKKVEDVKSNRGTASTPKSNSKKSEKEK